jgi:hypothetical protein
MYIADSNSPEKIGITANFFYGETCVDMLPKKVRSLHKNLVAEINRALDENPSDDQKRFLGELLFCISRLNAVLLQISRIAIHADVSNWKIESAIASIKELPPESAFAFTASEACTDFESLLFHCRALLDRITLVVSRQHKGNSDRFSRIKNILRQASAQDNRASKLLGLLKQTNTVNQVLTDLDGEKSLRSLVAHRSSIYEGISQSFTISRFKDRKFLAFDCESFGYPIVNTAHKLSLEIPFLILNAVAIYSGLHPALKIQEFTPQWDTQLVSYSDYIDSSKKGPLVCVASKMTRNGAQLRNEYVLSKIFENAFEA